LNSLIFSTQSYCEAVRSAILATAWLLVMLKLALFNSKYEATVLRRSVHGF